MEYVWECFNDEGVTKKAGKRKITIFIIYLALILILTLAVAVYSYAAESLTLEDAVETALRNNPGLKTSDDLVEAADVSVLRSASGFLPKVTLSETWSKTDNPLIVLGTKPNQEIVTPVTGCCSRKEYHKVALQSIETSATNDKNLSVIKNTRR
jgi:hypothetical protein